MLKNKVVLLFTALLAFSFSSSAMAVTKMKIQSVIGTLAASIDSFRVSSTVLRSKSQYRLFYSIATGTTAGSKGIIGTISVALM